MDDRRPSITSLSGGNGRDLKALFLHSSLLNVEGWGEAGGVGNEFGFGRSFCGAAGSHGKLAFGMWGRAFGME